MVHKQINFEVAAPFHCPYRQVKKRGKFKVNLSLDQMEKLLYCLSSKISKVLHTVPIWWKEYLMAWLQIFWEEPYEFWSPFKYASLGTFCIQIGQQFFEDYWKVDAIFWRFWSLKFWTNLDVKGTKRSIFKWTVSFLKVFSKKYFVLRDARPSIFNLGLFCNNIIIFELSYRIFPEISKNELFQLQKAKYRRMPRISRLPKNLAVAPTNLSHKKARDYGLFSSAWIRDGILWPYEQV